MVFSSFCRLKPNPIPFRWFEGKFRLGINQSALEISLPKFISLVSIFCLLIFSVNFVLHVFICSLKEFIIRGSTLYILSAARTEAQS